LDLVTYYTRCNFFTFFLFSFFYTLLFDNHSDVRFPVWHTKLFATGRLCERVLSTGPEESFTLLTISNEECKHFRTCDTPEGRKPFFHCPIFLWFVTH
jgi:hypothetical protein